MRKALLAVLAVLMAGVIVSAEGGTPPKVDPPKVEAPKAQANNLSKVTGFQCYGTPAGEAVGKFAGLLGYSYTFDASFEQELPCWIHIESGSLETSRRAIEYSVMGTIVVDEKAGTIRAYGVSGNGVHGAAHIYDVSAHCASYVEYVNKYAPRVKPQPPALPPKPGEMVLPQTPDQKCASETLMDVMGQALWDLGGAAATWSALGDKILIRAGDCDDARIREFLNQLTSDAPGVPYSAAQAKEARDRLEKTKLTFDENETPAASVLMMIARNCKQNMVIDANLAQSLADIHLTVSSKDKSATDWLPVLVPEKPLKTHFIDGFLAIRNTDDGVTTSDCYFVFELSALLERLAKAYDRQRTSSGREGGFDGDLRDKGGMKVVVDALNAYFNYSEMPEMFRSYGSRLVVTGDFESRQRVADILKGLGWEDPTETPRER